jgi:hypothetical protein
MQNKLLAAVGAGVLAAVALAAPAQAVALEINKATGTGITISPLNCAKIYDLNFPSLYIGRVCVQPEGDILHVEDNSADGHSIALRWENYYQGSLYRQGACVESRMAGSSGLCNKDYHEGSRLAIKACLWESATNTQLRCGSTTNVTV